MLFHLAISYRRTPLSDSGLGYIRLDRDTRVGPGVETTQILNLQGAVQVWVEHYSSNAPRQQVVQFPTSIDVYCYNCTWNNSGTLLQKAGLVTTMTQNASDILTATYRWWKVGQFVAASDGVTSWQPCATKCYLDTPSNSVRGQASGKQIQ
jgi:hypothetical protein